MTVSASNAWTGSVDPRKPGGHRLMGRVSIASMPADGSAAALLNWRLSTLSSAAADARVAPETEPAGQKPEVRAPGISELREVG